MLSVHSKLLICFCTLHFSFYSREISSIHLICFWKTASLPIKAALKELLPRLKPQGLKISFYFPPFIILFSNIEMVVANICVSEFLNILRYFRSFINGSSKHIFILSLIISFANNES